MQSGSEPPLSGRASLSRRRFLARLAALGAVGGAGLAAGRWLGAGSAGGQLAPSEAIIRAGKLEKALILPDLSALFAGPAASEWRNVRAFGAAGDRSQDDAPAILRAIADVEATGGVVYLPAGQYLIGDTIELPPRVALVGSGKGQTWLMLGSRVNKPVVANRDKEDGEIVIAQLSIDGNAERQTKDAYGILLGRPGEEEGPLRCRLYDVELTNCFPGGLYLVAARECALVGITASRNAGDGKTSGWGINLRLSSFCTLVDIVARENPMGGIEIVSWQPEGRYGVGSSNSIIGAMCLDNNIGLDIDDGHNMVVVASHFGGNRTAGISMFGSSHLFVGVVSMNNGVGIRSNGAQDFAVYGSRIVDNRQNIQEIGDSRGVFVAVMPPYSGSK